MGQAKSKPKNRNSGLGVGSCCTLWPIVKYEISRLPVDEPINPVKLNDIIDSIEKNLVLIGRALGPLQRLSEEILKANPSLLGDKPADS
jgi:hypothetical protein